MNDTLTYADVTAENVEQRFWPKVDRSGGPDACWIWKAKPSVRGYGSFYINHRIWPAHRVAYTLLVGVIPNGLSIDHLCRKPACVNPAHLEPVTHRENVLRGVSPPAKHARKDTCKNGHPFTADNLYQYDGKRMCRVCTLAKNQQARAKAAYRQHNTEYKRAYRARRRQEGSLG